MVVGGMPQAVDAYVNGKTFAQVLRASGHGLYFHEYLYKPEGNEKEQKYQMKMEDRYIIYAKDFKYEDGIMYIPVYMTMFI